MSTRPALGLTATLILGLMMFGTACAHRARVAVYAPGPPPPAVAESITVSPGTGYVWIPGFHRWDGNAYVWVPGRWENRPAGRRAWVPGHWNHDRHGYYWVEGHWR
jgi:hypothetical protein